MAAALAKSVTRGFSMPPCSHITDFCASGNIRETANDRVRDSLYLLGMEHEQPHYLKEWRKFRRMTQEALADAIETTKSVISDMERGNLQLSPKWAHRIAPVLRTTAGHLIDTDPNALDNDVLEIWASIPEENREQAARVLRSFQRDGTNG